MNMRFIKLIPFDVFSHIYTHCSFMIVVSELLKDEVSFSKRESGNAKAMWEAWVIWKAYPIGNQTGVHHTSVT